MDYKKSSEVLKGLLGMEKEAVGIKLLYDNNSVSGYNSERKYTFCQFVMKAREGEKLLATADNIACANGSSALGFMPVPEKLINGEFFSQLGSFQKDGAVKTMDILPRFKQNQFKEIALAPLSEVDFDPDVIIIETVPEHIMWLALSSLHKKGGRLQFSSSVSNGVCVDMTVIPHLSQSLNISLGCYGCRGATNILRECMLAGFPGFMLEEIIDSLKPISEKVMPRSREKKAYERLAKDE